jgi:hypothetical protein
MIPIIPVRMTESWLLIDKNAIKIAAGNRKYQGDIILPNTNQLETLSDPKDYLFDLIKQVSEKKGRKLKRLNLYFARYIISKNIRDYSVLRQLSAFRHLENEINKVMKEIFHF